MCCLDPEGSPIERSALVALGQRLAGADPVLCAAAAAIEPPGHMRLPVAAGVAPRAVWLTSPALIEDNPRAVGLLLAHLVRQEDIQVILAGVSSRARGLGLVPAALAHHLAAPYIALAEDVAPAQDAAASTGSITGVDLTLRLGAHKRRLHAPFPVVLTVATAFPDQQPNALNQDVREVAVNRLAPLDVGLDPARLNGRPEVLGEAITTMREIRLIARASEIFAAWDTSQPQPGP